jgi:2',3'-cyclic-nucleotide 2'-phosphodiesterase (5'-nucleotidase family)
MKITRRDLLRIGLAGSVLPAGNALAAALTKDVPQSQGPLAGASSVVLTLLHTNDPHGRIYLPDKAQGLTRLATIVRRVRAEMPNVLLLDAGDLIHGTPEEKAFEGKPMIGAMNALQYDAATAGNHEFDFGQRITRQAIETAQFPLLSANVLDEKTGQPWGGLKPYIIKEVQGVRVAIFGLTTVDTVRIQFPRTLQGIRFADPIETARTLVPELRKRADVVIFLSHLGYNPDRALAAAVPGIDIILGGHTHTRLAEQVWVGDTLVMQTGAHGKALGRADVLIERRGDGRVRLSINGREGKWWGHGGVAAPLGKTYPAGPLIDATIEVPHDAAVLASYADFREKILRRDAEVLTIAQVPLTAEGVKERQIALGTLLADAVRRKFKVDVGIVPSSAVVQGLPAGPVRVEHAMNTIGGYTRQHVVTARVTGQQLRSLHEKAAPSTRVMQMSGLVQKDGVLQVNGQPLRDESHYTVAGAAYIIQEHLLGREGVTILDDNPEAPGTREAIVELLRGHAPLTG